MNYMEHPDFDTVVDALAKSLRRSMNLVIDNLGIHVKLDELESWSEYVSLRDKMHTGFTSTWLYRFLFPGRYKRLYRAYLDVQLVIQQELLVAVIDKGKNEG